MTIFTMRDIIYLQFTQGELYKMAFCDILKELRAKAGVSQEELAKKVGVVKSAISMYENGDRFPKYETLRLMADFFRVDIDYLLGRESQTSGEKTKKQIGESEVKIALFGSDNEVTDEMWQKVKDYAEYLKSKYEN